MRIIPVDKVWDRIKEMKKMLKGLSKEHSGYYSEYIYIDYEPLDNNLVFMIHVEKSCSQTKYMLELYDSKYLSNIILKREYYHINKRQIQHFHKECINCLKQYCEKLAA